MPAEGAAMQCHAPFSSLYLDPRGFARACAVNNDVPLGNIGRESVLDLWRGAQAERLRTSFRSGGWGAGCEVCEWQSHTSGPDRSFARVFDRFAGDGSEPQWPRHIEFALGNTCNLRCIMCSGDLSSSIRTRLEGFDSLPEVYDERFFADLEVIAPHLEVAKFLGGEPFMVPAHHRVWDILEKCDPRPGVHVTTNGTVWNARVESVLETFDTSVAISMDGMRRATVERIRAGADYDTLLRNIDRFLAYTRGRGTHFGLTYCLMTENWDEFGAFLGFADDLDVDVFVNVVTMPSRYSLLRLPAEDLETVIRGLEHRHGIDGHGLEKNRHVWVEQLTQLRSRLTPEATTTAVDWWSTKASRLASDEAASGHRVARRDLDELRAWSGDGPTAVIELDERDTVLTATPDDSFLDMEFGAAGRAYDDLVIMLSSYYGRRTDVGWVRRRAGLEDRTARYETAKTVTDLRSITRRVGADRVRVTLTARSSPVGPGRAVPVAQPSVRSAAVSGLTMSSQGSIG